MAGKIHKIVWLDRENKRRDTYVKNGKKAAQDLQKTYDYIASVSGRVVSTTLVTEGGPHHVAQGR
jgi:hypothetical protein